MFLKSSSCQCHWRWWSKQELVSVLFWSLFLPTPGAVWRCAGHSSQLWLCTWKLQLDYTIALWKGFLCFGILPAYNTSTGTNSIEFWEVNCNAQERKGSSLGGAVQCIGVPHLSWWLTPGKHWATIATVKVDRHPFGGGKTVLLLVYQKLNF